MSALVWAGEHLDMRRVGDWEFAARKGDAAAVVIVAIEADHVLLVEQERPPAGGPVLELPAGLIGDADAGETPAAAARELEEETGWRADRIETLGEYLSSPGLTSERFVLVRAHGLTQVGAGGGVGRERITVHRVARPALPAFVAARRTAGVAVDAKVALLLGLGTG